LILLKNDEIDPEEFLASHQHNNNIVVINIMMRIHLVQDQVVGWWCTIDSISANTNISSGPPKESKVQNFYV